MEILAGPLNVGICLLFFLNLTAPLFSAAEFLEADVRGFETDLPDGAECEFELDLEDGDEPPNKASRLAFAWRL